MGSWSSTTRRGGWRDTDVWLDPSELTWFGELGQTVQTAVPAPILVGAEAGALLWRGPELRPTLSPGLGTLRRRRPGPSRAKRLTTRFVPTVTAVVAVSAATPMLLLARADRSAVAAPPVSPAAPAPATSAAAAPRLVQPLSAIPPVQATAEPLAASPVVDAAPAEPAVPAIRWRDSQAIGVPHAGQLVDGVRLPREGPGWVTWDPVIDRVPNRANRLYGTDGLLRVVLDVIAGYKAANPDAPPVVIGDLSLRRGGEMDQHVSHENGRDIDVYYPRLDGKARPPASAAQIDLARAQDLLDRFLAAGVEVVFVGHSTPFAGPSGRVVPYPNHNDHMHVRLAASAA